MDTKKIIEIVVVLVTLAGIAYWYFAIRPSQQVQVQVEETTQAIEQTIENSPTVAPATNPAASAVPAVNPLEKTNPFNSDYENPFQ